MLAVFAALMRVDAIRRFLWSEPLPVLVYSVMFSFTVVFALFIDSSIISRTLIIGVIIAPTLIATGAFAALAPKKETRVLRFLFAAALIVPGIAMVIRQIVWMLIPGEYSILSTDLPNTHFFFAAVIGDIMATGSFLLLNMVRSQKGLVASVPRLPRRTARITSSSTTGRPSGTPTLPPPALPVHSRKVLSDNRSSRS